MAKRKSEAARPEPLETPMTKEDYAEQVRLGNLHQDVYEDMFKEPYKEKE